MDYTWEAVDKLYAKGLINATQRSTLRGNILQEQNQFAGIHTRFVNNLVEDFEKGFGALLVSLKQTGTELSGAPTDVAKLKAGGTIEEGKGEGKYSGFFLAPAATAAFHALALLTGAPIIFAAGRTTGETVQDYLLKRGTNPDVAAVLATLADLGTQFSVGLGVGAAINWTTGAVSKAKDIVTKFKDDPALLKKIIDAMPASVVEKAAAMQAERDVAAVAAQAEKLAPKIKESRAGMDALARRAARYEEEKRALKAANAAAAKVAEIEKASVEARIKALDETHDLLAQAQSQMVPELTETQRTLSAAAQAVRGGPPTAEAVATKIARPAAPAPAAGTAVPRLSTGKAGDGFGFKLKDGTTIADPTARSHVEAMTNLGINPDDVVESGIIRQGQFADIPMYEKSGLLNPEWGKARMEAVRNAFIRQLRTEEPAFAAAETSLQRAADNLVEKSGVEIFGANPKLIEKLKAAGKTEDEIRRIITPRGTVPGYQEYLAVVARSEESYQKNKSLLEAGKINIEETINQASWIGKVKKDIAEITPGQAVDPLELAANSLVMKEHQREVFQLAQEAGDALARGDKTPFYRMLVEFHRLREVDPNYRMPLQTAGQTLRIAGKPTVNVTRYQDKVVETGSWLAGENFNSIEEIEANALNIIGRIQAMGNPDQLSMAAQGMNALADQVVKDPTLRDKMRFFFVNSIMSGTDTIGRNITGNLVAAPWHYFEKVTGAAASKALNPFVSAKHHVEAGYVSEANDFITTWASSMWDATRYALTKRWDKLADMVPQAARASLFEGRYDLPVFTTTGTTNPFRGLTGRVIGTPVGIAQAADEVARVAIYRAAVAERLKHAWISTGSELSWAQFREQGFRNVAPDMHEYAVRMAGLMTYSDKPSVFGKLLLLGREMIPGTEFIMPFIRTTDRLMAYGWNRSPVLSLASSKTLSEIASGDPLLRQEAIGRILWANITGAGLFLAARAKAPDGESYITGGGPTNRLLAASLRNAGAIHPYTIWTPAGRVPYHLIQPAAAPLGMIADTAEIWDELRPVQAESLWSAIALTLKNNLETAALAGSRNFMDTTYNQQIANIISVFDNPTDESNVSRILRQSGASIVKGFVEPAIVRQAFRAYDPRVKEVYDFRDELIREIPGEGLFPKLNPRTGEPIRNPPRLLEGTPGGWFLPTAPIQSEDDAVAKKFFELKMPFPDFPKAYGGQNPSEATFGYVGPLGPVKEAGAGIPYSPEQTYKGKRYAHEADDTGQTLDQEVKELLADPEFHKQAPIVQQEQIYAIYNRRINGAVGKLREEYPDLDTQLEAKRALRGELRLNPEEREGFQMEENAPSPTREPEETIDFGNPAIETEATP